jgi:hypothetical protein
MSTPEHFISIFARNCEVKAISKEEAAEFLRRHHLYGEAACRYRYGLYQVRGKNMPSKTNEDENKPDTTEPLVAVATFSSARKWEKEGREYRSYEWVRYASIQGTRVIGGMSKLLKHFIAEHKPDDVMAYAPEKYFTGETYAQLGFIQEDKKIFPNGNCSLKFRYRVSK